MITIRPLMSRMGGQPFVRHGPECFFHGPHCIFVTNYLLYNFSLKKKKILQYHIAFIISETIRKIVFYKYN